MTWADSSFLIPLLIEEDNSARAKTYLVENPQPVTVTHFSMLEAQHALRLATFRGEASESQLAQALLQFDHDIREGFFEIGETNFPSLLRQADRLSHRYAMTEGIRYLDLLHIAAALEMKCHRFLTFDKRQGKVAKAVGLEVRP